MSPRGAGALLRLSRQLQSAARTPETSSFSTPMMTPMMMARHPRFASTATTTATPKAPPPPVTKSQFERWREALRTAPPVAVLLGALGVIPFVALAPPVVKHIAWLLPYAVSERSDLFQVGYGVAIASFLGGVHWGAALSSPLTAAAGPVAARMAAERFTWGVVPGLLAWPLVAMEPAPASAMLALLMPALYLADRRFARRGLLPQWYMALRGPLTLGATFGLLLTASWHVHREADRVAKAAEVAAAKAAGAAAGAAEAEAPAAASAGAPRK